MERDHEFYEWTITKVDGDRENGWEINCDGRCSWVRPYSGEPHVGETIRFYGRGIGSPFRGQVINGITVFYQSESEYEAEWDRKQAVAQAEKVTKYAQDKPGFDERITAMPTVFQERIRGFRDRRVTFGPEMESYELFVCEQAIVIATAFEANDAIRAWAKLDYGDQREALPALSDGHSGNTFGAAVSLAILFKDQPDLVPQQHGALCPLVGCDSYGCWSTTQDKAA